MDSAAKTPTASPATAPTQSPKVVVTKAPPLVQSWAIRKHALRESLVSFVKDLEFPHHTNLSQLADIKTFVLSRIAAAPADCNAFELVIEANPRENAEQVHIILFNKPV